MNRRLGAGRVAQQAAVGVAAGALVVVVVWFTVRTLNRGHVAELAAAGVVVVVVVALVSVVATRHVLSDLQRLRLLIGLLSGASVVAVELTLYALDMTGLINELAEHVLATSIFGLGAVGLSVYLMRSFSRLGNELDQRARRLQALHTCSTSLAAERGMTALHERITQYGRALGAADACALTDTEGSGDRLGFASRAEGDVPADRAMSGRPASSLTVSLPVATAPTLMLTLTRQARFDDQDRLFLEMYAVAAAAAIDSARRLQDAQTIATVEERERIARDLHDELGQLLGFLTTMVQAIRELVGRGDTSRAEHELSRLETACRGLGVQVREAILGLRTRVQVGQSMEGTLREFVADFGALAGLETSLRCEPSALTGLSAVVQYQLLQIIREAMSNARRHAQGRRVDVQARCLDGMLEVSVSDDGRGAMPGPTAGFGLKTMAERARALGGSLYIDSSPGSGTVVTVRIPEPRGVGYAGAAGR